MYFPSACYLRLVLTEPFKCSTFHWIPQSIPLPPPRPPCNSLFYGLSQIYIPYLCLPVLLHSMLLTWHSATNQLQNSVTHLIKPFEGTLPPYIYYSKHFIQLLEFPQTYPGNIFPHPLLVCYFTGSAHRIL